MSSPIKKALGKTKKSPMDIHGSFAPKPVAAHPTAGKMAGKTPGPDRREPYASAMHLKAVPK